MSKKLTASTINKLNKELDKKKKIYILGDEEVIINESFKESVIDKVVFDYITLFEEASRNGSIDEDFIRGTGGILHTLILRDFSDVPMIPKKRDLEKLLQVTNVLYDSGIMEAVISEFEESELKRVYSKLEKNSKRVGEVLGEYALSSALAEGGSENDNSQEHKGTGEGDSTENK